jgi:hypothetical protein
MPVCPRAFVELAGFGHGEPGHNANAKAGTYHFEAGCNVAHFLYNLVFDA